MTQSKWRIAAVALSSIMALSYSHLPVSLAAQEAAAGSPDGPQCKRIRAKIVDTSAPVGCTSPFNFCAAGTIEGNHGLNGTTYFVLDGVAPPPATAPGWVMTTGTMVITTAQGTLSARQTGVSKLVGRPSNGYLTEMQEISGGTGRFEGATGLLYLNGTDVNSVFFSNVTGEVCVPR